MRKRTVSSTITEYVDLMNISNTILKLLTFVIKKEPDILTDDDHTALEDFQVLINELKHEAVLE